MEAKVNSRKKSNKRRTEEEKLTEERRQIQKYNANEKKNDRNGNYESIEHIIEIKTRRAYNMDTDQKDDIKEEVK